MAVALHLFQRAERSNGTLQLYIRGHRVEWERIQSYLKKNKTSAPQLLAEKASYDSIPHYIKYDIVYSTDAAMPLSSPPSMQPGPALVASSSHLTPGPTIAISTSEPTPEGSPNNSSAIVTPRTYLLTPESQKTTSEEDSITPSTEAGQRASSMQRKHDILGLGVGSEVAPIISQTSPRIFQLFVGNLTDTTDAPVESRELLDLYRIISVTPSRGIDSTEQSKRPLGESKSSLYPDNHMSNDQIEVEQHRANWIDGEFHDHQQLGPDAFAPRDCRGWFILWTMTACLRKYEGSDQDAELAMKKASTCFQKMVADRHNECLTSLNFILAVLDAHDKREIAIDLLQKCSTATSLLPSLLIREPVVRTIQFKIRVMSGLEIERMCNPADLRHILSCMENSWGPDSPSTLACRYNLGWRLAGDGDPARLVEARNVLYQAHLRLKLFLGERHPQVVMCLTVLARVLYNLKEHAEGLKMMRTAMDRINSCFTDNHPYRLAALRRFSIFMQKAGSDDAEPLLREVAARRVLALGLKCRLTQASIHELEEFLIKQGRDKDAGDACKDAIESAPRMSCGEDRVQLF